MPRERKTEHPHVVKTEGIVGGRPRIKGTRISVELIARFFKDGVSPQEILDTYPHLKAAAVYDATASDRCTGCPSDSDKALSTCFPVCVVSLSAILPAPMPLAGAAVGAYSPAAVPIGVGHSGPPEPYPPKPVLSI